MLTLSARSLSAAGLVVAGLLLSACGSGVLEARAVSSGSSASAPSSAPAPSSAAEDATVEAFCEQQQSLSTEVGSELQSVGADPEAAEEALASISDELDEVEPPADIEADWTSFVGAFDDLHDLVADAASGKISDTTEYIDQVQDIQNDLIDSGQAVDAWAADNC